MEKIIKIGTRDSELALWQANKVRDGLEKLGCRTEIVPVKSDGDIILDKPLYELGITGIFTKTLDVAMIQGKIDVAVHSMKDVPTALPKGIVQAAVLQRADTADILVHKGDLSFLEHSGTIATGSLRRKAQWLHRYPGHTVENLRGNINTRMRKLQDNDWQGAIFAAAGLERISPFAGTDLNPEHRTPLEWMVPAPAQGAMVAVALEKDTYSQSCLSKLNHRETEICTYIERQFLRVLEGGCTAPIGALATIAGDTVSLTGILLSPDGRQKLSVKKEKSLNNYHDLGSICALEILDRGGKEIMKHIKSHQPGPGPNGKAPAKT
ncbi:hydroxymethylbilane synthase [Sinomicrobium weinanense]|uniref:Hydroxymethylbilane synthase n=1 Tax=Sinomicrobium weinanense TaxID=2842200 RepID=A0A926Q081_9FLAO|nr:hydroxymethylbilane synthase [Sinomicrobium weinanense]MBC9794618.1 hydroxymethylbilane synthase [Sinomicrobium weinanense]MBU3124103.1 hydroxymethylbilane synthase [Sinomicrobium weinanense]